MQQKGVLYDVGRVLGQDWRPDYSPALVRRELEIIAADLHCNAVRLCGYDLGRLLPAAEVALERGLQVWLSPELWNASPERTLAYISDAAAAAEPLRRRFPDRLVFSVGNELTLFMRGIVPGRSFVRRTRLPALRAVIKDDRHTPPLRAFLAEAANAVRDVYHGQISYSALTFEHVDWDLFDLIGINHYWNTRTAERYEATLAPLLATGKPVVVTELGFPACTDASDPAMLTLYNATTASVLAGGLPIVGRLLRPRVRRIYQRDEPLQARLLADQLALLDRLGVDGAYIMSFAFPLAPYDPDPRHDIDATSLSLVRTLPRGDHGTTYPDLPWEPKQAFHAVADYYAQN
jgi:hypothetical protein